MHYNLDQAPATAEATYHYTNSEAEFLNSQICSNESQTPKYHLSFCHVRTEVSVAFQTVSNGANDLSIASTLYLILLHISYPQRVWSIPLFITQSRRWVISAVYMQIKCETWRCGDYQRRWWREQRVRRSKKLKKNGAEVLPNNWKTFAQQWKIVTRKSSELEIRW